MYTLFHEKHIFHENIYSKGNLVIDFIGINQKYFMETTYSYVCILNYIFKAL